MLPVHVAPVRETGLRLEGDLMIGPVGVVVSGDIWLFAPDAPRVTWTVLGAVSF